MRILKRLLILKLVGKRKKAMRMKKDSVKRLIWMRLRIMIIF